jgi:hypothetical protein
MRSRATLASELGARPLGALLAFAILAALFGCNPKTWSLEKPGTKVDSIQLQIEEGDMTTAFNIRAAQLAADEKAFADKDAVARTDLADQQQTNLQIVQAIEGLASAAANAPISTAGFIGIGVQLLGIAGLALHVKNAVQGTTPTSASSTTAPPDVPKTG